MKTSSPVAFFLPNLDGGGAERVTLHLAQGFAARGFKVDLVLAKVEGEYLATVPPEIRIVNLGAKFPVIVSKTLALRDYLKRDRPLALFSALDILSSATWAKRWSGVSTQIFMCVHTNLTQQFQDKPQLGLWRLRTFFIRQFYPWADKILAVSKGVAEDVENMAGLPSNSVSVIYNPVVTPELFEKAKQEVDHAWFQPGEPPVILGVGRLVKQKDFATLIRAFALVRQQQTARLMILGFTDKREPSVKPELEFLIQELGLDNEVALPGFVDNPYTYMANAGVFVLSSIYEGFGNVIAEALATGTPVVSTDCESGPSEILENGKHGRLVPVGDVEALADAILATLHQPSNVSLLQQRAQAFSIDTIVDQYVSVLNEVCKLAQ